MLPCYVVQGIGYGLIAEKGLDLGTTSRGGVLYWACQHDQVISRPKAFYEPGTFWMPFVPQPLEYPMDCAKLTPLLKEAMKLWDADAPPERTEGCEDCPLLDTLMELEREVRKHQTINDRRLLAATANDTRYQNAITSRRYAEACARINALRELSDGTGELGFQDDGIVSHWEYFE